MKKYNQFIEKLNEEYMPHNEGVRFGNYIINTLLKLKGFPCEIMYDQENKILFIHNDNIEIILGIIELLINHKNDYNKYIEEIERAVHEMDINTISYANVYYKRNKKIINTNITPINNLLNKYGIELEIEKNPQHSGYIELNLSKPIILTNNDIKPPKLLSSTIIKYVENIKNNSEYDIDIKYKYFNIDDSLDDPFHSHYNTKYNKHVVEMIFKIDSNKIYSYNYNNIYESFYDNYSILKKLLIYVDKIINDLENFSCIVYNHVDNEKVILIAY